MIQKDLPILKIHKLSEEQFQRENAAGRLEEDALYLTPLEALPNPNALTFTGAVNATYDGSQPVSVEIPVGGVAGGGNANVWFHDIELTEEATGVDITFPVPLGKFVILNMHFTFPGLATNMAIYSRTGNLNYESWGTATVNATDAPGANAYCVRYNNTEFFASIIVDAIGYNARPSTPFAAFVHGNLNVLTVYSNTTGVNFPVGTKVEIWGVYAV